MSERLPSRSAGSNFIDELLESIKNSLGLTDYEVEILRKVNKVLREPTPTTQVGIEERVSVLDRYRVDLLNLLYMLEDKLATLEYSYKNVYDPEFMKLTRQGRPSQQAIDSEIHATNASMNEWRNTMHHYDYVKSLILGYIKSIGASKDTCMKKWGFQ